MFERVRISPARHEEASEIGTDRQWSLRGFDIRSALARVCGILHTRIELPVSLDTGDRYDFVIDWPPTDDQSRKRMMREGIEAYFGIGIADRMRAADVFVMTAPDGPGPALRYVDDGQGGGIGACGVSFAMPDADGLDLDALRERFSSLMSMRQAAAGAAIGGISASGATLDDVCSTLEPHLGRPVVNDTGLPGRYDLQIEAIAPNTAEFLATLRDRAGLLLTPDRRPIQVLVVSLN